MSVAPTAPLVHPLTFEVLPDNDPAVLRRALNDMEQSWRAARRIRERVAELEPFNPPRPTRQTDRQRAASRCPRCGGRVTA